MLYSSLGAYSTLTPVHPSLNFTLNEQSGMQPSDSACATLGHGWVQACRPRRMPVELADATLDQVQYLPHGHNLVRDSTTALCH